MVMIREEVQQMEGAWRHFLSGPTGGRLEPPVAELERLAALHLAFREMEDDRPWTTLDDPGRPRRTASFRRRRWRRVETVDQTADRDCSNKVPRWWQFWSAFDPGGSMELLLRVARIQLGGTFSCRQDVEAALLWPRAGNLSAIAEDDAEAAGRSCFTDLTGSSWFWVTGDSQKDALATCLSSKQMAVGGASRVACLVGAMLSPKDGRRWARVERSFRTPGLSDHLTWRPQPPVPWSVEVDAPVSHPAGGVAAEPEKSSVLAGYKIRRVRYPWKTELQKETWKLAFDEPQGHLSHLFKGRLFRVHIGKWIEECVVTDVSVHPVEQELMFVRFDRHIPGKMSVVPIPVSISGLWGCPGYRKGGHQIPPPLVVDVSNLHLEEPFGKITLRDMLPLLPKDGTVRFAREYSMDEEVITCYDPKALGEDPNFDHRGGRYHLTFTGFWPKQ
eukprot:g32429.t1